MRTLLFLTAMLTALTVAAQSPDADGEVTKIDKAQAKVTLRHGEIKSLDMPAMTMVFRVSDAKLLDSLAVGDKVRFAAEKRDGVYTVVAMQKTGLATR